MPLVTTGVGTIGSRLGLGLSRGAAFLTKGCCSSCTAEGREDGFLCKHCLTKSLQSSERCSGIPGSSLLCPILKIAATWKTHKMTENDKVE